jgi:hypothetical protein
VERFLTRFGPLVSSVLSGFDRVVFHGILQPLMREFGMYYLLKDAGVQLLDFKDFAQATTARIKKASLAVANRDHRPILYLDSPGLDKQELARKTLADSPVEQGLICVFSAVEPCTTFEYQRSTDREQRGLRPIRSKCLHLYHYWLHPQFGFMNARIQTWFPFNIQICINGREWLARQLLRKGQNNFKRADNCFTWLGNPKLAQRLMNEQLATAWPRALKAIARSLNPAHEAIFRSSPMDYYWTAYQTELATDVLFRDPQSLARIYPQLVRFAMHAFKSPDVMRFLAQKTSPARSSAASRTEPRAFASNTSYAATPSRCTTRLAASSEWKPPSAIRPTSKCSALARTTRTGNSSGSLCAKASRISIAAPRSHNDRIIPTSTLWPQSAIPLLARNSSIPSPGLSSIAAAAFVLSV